MNLSPCDLNISNGNQMVHIANSTLRNNKATDLDAKFFAFNNSFHFNVPNKCDIDLELSAFSIVKASSNQTLFIFLENNKLKYTSHKYNASNASDTTSDSQLTALTFNAYDVTAGDSQLKFFGLNTNKTFGQLKSTIERGTLKK